MALNTHITYVLNGTIESVKSVIPINVDIDQPYIPKQPISRSSMSVQIAITGSINGQIIIGGNEQVFSKIGEAMFGMSLEGEMLQSFTSELGNMIAGHLATSIANKGLEMDITPPSVLEEQSQVAVFDKALSLPIHFTAIGSFTIILLMQKAS